MEITLRLSLPRDGASIPAARKVLAGGLRALGAEHESVADIELALTEACANVLEHSESVDEYEIEVHLGPSEVLISVRNEGESFDGNDKGHADAVAEAEGGRGIQLMRALVDEVKFTSNGEGTVLELEKHLEWREKSVMRQMADAESAAGEQSGGDVSE